MSHTRGNRSDYLPCLVQLVVGLLQLHGVLVSQLLHNSLVAVRLFVHLPLQLRHFLFTLPTKFLRRGCCVQRIFQLALQSLQLLTDYRRGDSDRSPPPVCNSYRRHSGGILAAAVQRRKITVAKLLRWNYTQAEIYRVAQKSKTLPNYQKIVLNCIKACQ